MVTPRHVHVLIGSPLFPRPSPARHEPPSFLLIFATLLQFILYLYCAYPRTRNFLPSLPVMLALGASPPLLCLIMRYDWVTVARCSVALTLTSLVRMVEQWSKEGDLGVQEMEKLKYDAKGA